MVIPDLFQALSCGYYRRSLDTTKEVMPAKDILPECESPSNTESDRDPNTDELPSKPADGDNDSAKSVVGEIPSQF
ncbi:hypothetical protein GCK32_014611 [Trichostrongylus colubriformis]|uniref:Uncharacterized protein n=1 Tax=Trichostrongylus colubriformis TaxID=6319 RepID=A0AAN8FPG1_TRICO